MAAPAQTKLPRLKLLLNRIPERLASSPSTSSDQDFVTKAAQGNSAEVELGKIVAAKSKNPNVKQFAQMMVKDHTTALNELQELAQTKNLNFNDDLA